MTIDPDLSQRVLAELERDPALVDTLERRRMFGQEGFMVRGALLVTAGTDGLLVRYDPADADALLARPGATQAFMGQRTMGPGWLSVASEALDDGNLRWWLETALAFNASRTE